jgi:tryptophan synthase alpha subunit
VSRTAPTLQKLQARERKALIPYVTVGFPYADITPALMHDMVAADTDIIELGVPFSDPTTDGPMIQKCADFAAQLKAAGLDLIFLLAPTSTAQRIRQVAEIGSGYVYYVSLKGVTGSGALNTVVVQAMLSRIRQHVHIPVGVGCGIRDVDTARNRPRGRRGSDRQSIDRDHREQYTEGCSAGDRRLSAPNPRSTGQQCSVKPNKTNSDFFSRLYLSQSRRLSVHV